MLLNEDSYTAMGVINLSINVGMKKIMIMLLMVIALLITVFTFSNVASATESNLALNADGEGYPMASSSNNCCEDSAWNAVNGTFNYSDASHDRWTNWGEGNGTDWVALDFGPTAITFNQVKLYLYNDGDGVQAPASYVVQYFDGLDWVNTTNTVYSPTSPTTTINSEATPDNTLNIVNFDTVVSNQLRVVLTNSENSYSGIVELEVFYTGEETYENPYSYTVSFVTDSDSIITDQVIEYNLFVIEPEAPTKTGYAFVGWYSDERMHDAYSFSTPVTDDIILYAKWESYTEAEALVTIAERNQTQFSVDDSYDAVMYLINSSYKVELLSRISVVQVIIDRSSIDIGDIVRLINTGTLLEKDINQDQSFDRSDVLIMLQRISSFRTSVDQ